MYKKIVKQKKLGYILNRTTMRNTFFFTLILLTTLLACKKPDVLEKVDECKPKDPVTYFEVDRMNVFTIGIHVPSSRIRIGFSDTSQYAKQLKNYYPELIHELSTYTFCPCNLPEQFQKEGKKFRISGVSRIERGYLRFNQNLVEHPTNQAYDADECLPFEITKIEAIE